MVYRSYLGCRTDPLSDNCFLAVWVIRALPDVFRLPTLALVVERERERLAFKPEDYWVISGGCYSRRLMSNLQDGSGAAGVLGSS